MDRFYEDANSLFVRPMMHSTLAVRRSVVMLPSTSALRAKPSELCLSSLVALAASQLH